MNYQIPDVNNVDAGITIMNILLMGEKIPRLTPASIIPANKYCWNRNSSVTILAQLR
jgi:hypothetical protein